MSRRSENTYNRLRCGAADLHKLLDITHHSHWATVWSGDQRHLFQIVFGTPFHRVKFIFSIERAFCKESSSLCSRCGTKTGRRANENYLYVIPGCSVNQSPVLYKTGITIFCSSRFFTKNILSELSAIVCYLGVYQGMTKVSLTLPMTAVKMNRTIHSNMHNALRINNIYNKSWNRLPVNKLRTYAKFNLHCRRPKILFALRSYQYNI